MDKSLRFGSVLIISVPIGFDYDSSCYKATLGSWDGILASQEWDEEVLDYCHTLTVCVGLCLPR